MNKNTSADDRLNALSAPDFRASCGTVRPALPGEEAVYARLAHALWPDGGERAHLEEGKEIFASDSDRVFFAESAGNAVGFAHASLRFDYVEGASGSPVGYLEGIYVSPACRHSGIARALLKAAENWAKAQGAEEFASDCELDNTESLRFHEALGFQEANRIICFIKTLK